MAGQGSYLWIVNATDQIMSLKGENKGDMNSWSFVDLSPNSQRRFFVQFSGAGRKPTWQKQTRNGSSQATATFSLADKTTFVVQIQGGNVVVDWGSTDFTSYAVFPPPDPSKRPTTLGTLGWVPNASMCMLVQKISVPSAISRFQTGVFGAAVPMAKSAPSLAPVTGLGPLWMSYYAQVIGSLSLTEMSLPGTHDSGTWQPACCLSTPWVRTQSCSLYDQLNLGIRVLDLRIGQVQPGEYIICHDIWRTQYSLSGALKEVKDFIDSSEKEIVILDFHRFVSLQSGVKYDFAQLTKQVKSILNGYYLPVGVGKGKTLADIWKAGPGKGRVVVAWNDTSSLDASFMWPGVDQHWYQNASSDAILQQDLEKDFSSPPSTSVMWSSCVFRSVNAFNTPLSNAKSSSTDIDNWFYGCADWTLKANIISTNFFQLYDNIVQACICASILKAGSK